MSKNTYKEYIEQYEEILTKEHKNFDNKTLISVAKAVKDIHYILDSYYSKMKNIDTFKQRSMNYVDYLKQDVKIYDEVSAFAEMVKIINAPHFYDLLDSKQNKSVYVLFRRQNHRDDLNHLYFIKFFKNIKKFLDSYDEFIKNKNEYFKVFLMGDNVSNENQIIVNLEKYKTDYVFIGHFNVKTERVIGHAYHLIKFNGEDAIDFQKEDMTIFNDDFKKYSNIINYINEFYPEYGV